MPKWGILMGKIKLLACFVILLIQSNDAFSSFCQSRKQRFTQIVNSADTNENFNHVIQSSAKLIVFGEPHQTHYLEKLPEIIPQFVEIDEVGCFFIEQPTTLQQMEIDQLISGNTTEHFQTQASFQYAPLYAFLRSQNIRIIPVDDPVVKSPFYPLHEWMVKRDDTMFEVIHNNLASCGKSLFIVGKHHITPDIAAYDNFLGKRLRESLTKDETLFIDLIHEKNYFEDYCSYRENLLFEETVLFSTEGLNDLEYSPRSDNSFFTDFDFVYYLLP